MRNNFTFKKNHFALLFIISLTIFTITKAHSQCTAGTPETTIEFCDISTPPKGIVDLPLFMANHTPGGIWSAKTENSGLDYKTGRLNILAIKNSGKHEYIYTVTCPEGGTSTASVILILGPYIGKGGDGGACSDDSQVNLFQFLTGPFNPHGNGTWSSTDADHAITGSTFDATKVEEEKTYHFTYSLKDVENCLGVETSFTVKVSHAPKPGVLNNSPANEPFCETDDLSGYTNVDLFDLIDNEDSGGIWTDASNTGQLANGSDSTINIPEILANQGPGTYSFIYKVESVPVCKPDRTVEVQIVIKERLDFSNTTFKINPAICIDRFEETDFSATLQQEGKPVPDGIYTIEYTTRSTIIKTKTIIFQNGKAEFPIDAIDKRDLFITGDHTLKIVSITSETSCNNIMDDLQASLVLNPSPDTMEHATLLAEPVCLGESTVIKSTNPLLTDGEYLFTYNLSGSNQKTGEIIEVIVTNGHFSFTVPSTLLLETGETTITITKIENTETGCSVLASPNVSVPFTIYKRIDFTPAKLSVTTNICLDDLKHPDFQIIAEIKQPENTDAIPDGIYSVTYTINGSSNLYSTTIIFKNGQTSFPVDRSSIDLENSGTYILTVSSIKENGINNACENPVNNEPLEIKTYKNPNNEGLTIKSELICEQDKAYETVQINLSNALQLVNGTYEITYNLSGKNIKTDEVVTLAIENGKGSFQIPSNSIPNTGETTITITKIGNVVTGCSVTVLDNISTSFITHKIIDFTPAKLSVTTNICLDDLKQPGFQIITEIKQPENTDTIPDGIYSVTYTINGSNNLYSATVTFKNGQTSFPVDRSSISIENAGDYLLTISSIKENGINNVCENPVNNDPLEIKIYKNPTIEGLSLKTELVCEQGKEHEVVFVTLTNALQLVNGTYEITYNLSGKNIKTDEVVTLTIENGKGSFQIPPTAILNTGKTTITLTSIKNKGAECSEKIPDTFTSEFETHKTATIKEILLNVNNNGVSCQDNNIDVVLSGLDILTDITITYAVSGANSIANQTLKLTVSDGIAKFTIDRTLLPNKGNMTLIIVAIQNNTKSCPTIFPSFPEKEITIFEKPEKPKVSGTAIEFCSDEKPTLEDLNPIIENLNPGSNRLLWFNDASDTDILPIQTALTQGVYWVVEENNGGCVSERVAVTVIIHQVATPVLQSEGQKFCGLDKPTISHLNEKILTDETIIWFDAESNGNIITKTELLKEGHVYYGYSFSETTQCMSEKPLAVTVSLTNCDAEDNEFFIPDGFSPNEDGLNDTFEIPNIGYIYPNFSLEIYNRYGNLLFKGNKNTPSWDGRNTHSKSVSNGIVPNGVYYYILNFNKGNKPPKQGYLYLNR